MIRRREAYFRFRAHSPTNHYPQIRATALAPISRDIQMSAKGQQRRFHYGHSSSAYTLKLTV
jgi:hypothetical protein